jgi:GLPGLI family protein
MSKIIYILFLVGSLSFSQNIEVIYEAKFIAVPNSEPKNISPEDLKLAKTVSQKIANSVENQKIVLIASESSFILTVEEQMNVDNESMGSIVGRSVLNLYSYIYTSEVDYSYGNDLGKENVIKFSNHSVIWEITRESKDILGFNCLKATPNYNNFSENRKRGLPTSVWFTPEINKMGGPSVYHNLPGLILEVESELVRITAVKISNVAKVIKFPETDKDIVSNELDYKMIEDKANALRERMKK